MEQDFDNTVTRGHILKNQLRGIYGPCLRAVSSSTADKATGHMYVGGSVGGPYHTDYNGQSIHKVGIAKYGIKLFSCVFNGPQKFPKVTTCTRIRR